MNWWPCDGCECKLGWGWNESMARLIPVEGRPRNITSKALNQSVYSVYSLSSTVLICWVSFLLIH